MKIIISFLVLAGILMSVHLTNNSVYFLYAKLWFYSQGFMLGIIFRNLHLR